MFKISFIDNNAIVQMFHNKLKMFLTQMLEWTE